MASGRRPLEDVRIIAIEQYGAGPYGSSHLAEMGAEIIKVEDPRTGGDVGRYVPPFAEDEDSLFFQTFNLGKRSISLDLSTEAGYAVLCDLVQGADAVYSNLRGDIPPRLRITYEDLKGVNPAIVCCSLSGFGLTGPRAKEPAYDYILQGIAGWMSLTGEPDGPPTKSGLSLVDYCGGVFAALALVTGIHAARRDGLGMDCDVSLFDVAIGMLTYPATWLLNEGYEVTRTPRSAHPSLVPFQNFQTADGWIVVGCAKEKFFARLAEAIERPDLAADERFATFGTRREHREELLRVLEDAFRTRSSAVWLERLGSAGVPCGPVNSVAQALSDPHTEARKMIAEVDHPTRGRIRVPASPLRVGSPPAARSAAPRRDADAAAILAELGYDGERVRELGAAGAFGRQDPGALPEAAQA
jgi:crotonobetainyl-CoA:carnitine CoA-transferase CaiB-like acyl-CoA transferase